MKLACSVVLATLVPGSALAATPTMSERSGRPAHLERVALLTPSMLDFAARPLAAPTEPVEGASVLAEPLEGGEGQGAVTLAVVIPTRDRLCEMLETEAAELGMPPAFFARLIWQESRFNADAVSHAGARGIAQFMPDTATEWGLDNPFDPAAALRHSARFLSALRAEFGNLGLAAAAYNAGSGRVQRWLGGKGGLPKETRDYVQIVTGLSAEAWRNRTALPASLQMESHEVRHWCRSLPEIRLAPPNRTQPSRIVTASVAAETPPPPPIRASAAGKTTPEAGPQWLVQLAAGPSMASARALLAKARKTHAGALAKHPPTVAQQRAAAKGSATQYAVRVAMASRDAADALCARLRKEGGACTVFRD